MEIATSMAAYRRYLRDLVELRAGQPGDDLTSDLLAIHREDPDRFTREAGRPEPGRDQPDRAQGV